MRGRQRIIYSLNYYVELIGRLRGKFGFFEGPRISQMDFQVASDTEVLQLTPRLGAPPHLCYQCNPWLVRVGCQGGDDFFEARVATQRIPKRQ